ncbi:MULTISPECIES: arginine repressor [Corallococcus]|uniref:arginine repressor n=1 Tax=Corallococcus TaxID=83461 RepID=UPI00117C1ADD|nr:MULTISPECIES: arginine repressor [Corallococcus]NBD13308.1 arginine repressor [Corallococcus silvisoli]TSC23439.1 arginine repressor [Corallococcus sp. Z5C101001]
MNLDEAILQLISQQDVPDQAVLQTLLEEAGHAPSQSTLSRRLRKLSVQKVNGRYQRMEVPAPAPAAAPRVSIIEAPPNMLVLKTAPGYAQIFGLALDREEVEGLAGTVAGDDTIFIAVKDPSLLQDVRATVEQLIQRGP